MAHLARLLVGFVVVAASLTLLAPAAQAAAPTITTFAGSSPGYSGDGGPATSAQMLGPGIGAVDSIGNFYIADFDNGTVRKVTPGGTISTVAGTGTNGYSGDGSLATSAQLNNCNGVAVDSAGNLYIADSTNNRVRKVTATTGIITTIAGTGTAAYSGDGGAATSAGINAPLGVALDSTGNVYIADLQENRIRKVTIGTGIITTVAGNGTGTFAGDGGAATSASINGPFSVKFDASGNMYIADGNNNRIRKVTIGGIISTVAGNGTPGSSGDGGAAISAKINDPADMVVSAQGNIYIADFGGNLIRKVDALGNISTVAGNQGVSYTRGNGNGGPATSAALDCPDGVAMDAAGNVYVSDCNEDVREVNFGDPPSWPNIPVTFSIDPALTFAVAGYNSGSCNGATVTSTSSTATAIPFGHVSYLANSVGGQTLTISTNASSGYTVFVKSSGLPSDGNGHTVANWTGTNASPTAFSASGTAAFGYTTDHALSGTSTRFQTNKWAAATASGAEVMYQTGPVSADVAHVCFQEGVSATTPAGSYSTTVTYTAVPIF